MSGIEVRQPTTSPGRFSRVDYNALHIDVNNGTTNWHDLVGPADMSLTGLVAGQVVAVGLSTAWGNEAPQGYLDVASIVSGSPVNVWSTSSAEVATSFGVVGWTGVGSVISRVGTVVARPVVSGDLVAGALTLRVRGRVNAVGTKTLNCQTPFIFTVWAQVLG